MTVRSVILGAVDVTGCIIGSLKHAMMDYTKTGSHWERYETGFELQVEVHHH